MNEMTGADNRPYFEGWYFKHQNETNTIAFIPGVNYEANGRKSAFVQVITDHSSYNIPFPITAFHLCPHVLSIRIGEQLFSQRGIRVNLNTSDFQCRGTIKYGPLKPPESDVMGPFRFIPFMECNHGVISMKHRLKGSLEVNGVVMDFDDGIGYIEKDWGSSFPKKYLWVQCNRFPEPTCSVMVSIAEIPLFGFSFNGCIAVLLYRGSEYRFATYNGVRILRWDKTGFLLKQHEMMLEAEITGTNGFNLNAPQNGVMNRIIRESSICRARFRFYYEGHLIFDLQSDEAGFEFVE